jgi:hypothetical protein
LRAVAAVDGGVDCCCVLVGQVRLLGERRARICVLRDSCAIRFASQP